MSKISIKAITRKFDNGWLLLPATPADRRTLDLFAAEANGKYINITANYARDKKTYDQVKTVWALISILFELQNQYKPTTEQSAQLYASLIEEYADTYPDPRHPEKLLRVTLSDMTVEQATRFIQSILNEIISQTDSDDTGRLLVDLKDVFETFEAHKGTLKQDPTDYSKDGVLLSVDEWRRRNNHSFASGETENLEIAHIVTKKRCPQFRDCPWNFLLLTHYEHIEIQHRYGWKHFLEIYPHLEQRVRRAYEMAGQLDKLGNPIYDVVMTGCPEQTDNLANEALEIF